MELLAQILSLTIYNQSKCLLVSLKIPTFACQNMFRYVDVDFSVNF